jgi:ubiquinone/menaquinone biosynthesis C-methylase UbiE
MTNPIVSVAHKFLSLPLAYDLFQRAVGSAKYIENLTVKTLAMESNFVLDLGCGTGRAISKLHDQSSYLGMDLSSNIFEKLRKLKLRQMSR